MAKPPPKTKDGRCRKHKLRVDKDGYCIRCRKEQTQAKGKKALYWVAGGVGVVAVIALLVVIQIARGSSDEPVAAAPAPPQEAEQPAEGVAQPVAKAPTQQDETQERQAKALDKARRQLEVTLYTGSSCPDCAKAREWLRDNRIRFRSRNVDSSESAKRELLEKNPGGRVPTIVVDDEVIVGFSEAGLKGRIEWAAMMRARGE